MWIKIVVSASGLKKYFIPENGRPAHSPSPNIHQYSSTSSHSSWKKNQHHIDIQKIVISPTWQGVLFFTLLGVIFLGAINYQNSLGIFSALLIFGMLFFSGLETFHTLKGLNFDINKLSPVFCEESITVSLDMDNTDQAARHALQFTLVSDMQGQQPHIISHIPANTRHALMLLLPAKQRGQYTLQKIKIATRYSLGMIEASTTVPVNMKLMVYPKISALPAKLSNTTGNVTELHTNSSGDTDYIGVRQYVAGDSPRMINWKSVAAGKGVLVNEYSGPENNEQELYIDWQHYENYGVEERLTLMTAAILKYNNSGQAYGIDLPGTRITPDRGDNHKNNCLAILACFQLSDATTNCGQNA